MNYYVILLASITIFYGCSNNLSLDSVPKASSEVFNIRKNSYSDIMKKYSFNSEDTKEEQLKKIQLMYKKDINNNQIFQRVYAKGKSSGGEQDSIISIQNLACQNAVLNAIQDVNGVFIQSITKVQNSLITREDIVSNTLGVVKIKQKKTYPSFKSSGGFSIECEIEADVPEIEYKLQTH